MLRARIDEVERRMEAAARRAGRRREEIILVAVTKMFPASAVRAAYEAGLREFGENYVREFEGKRPELADLAGARFHLIGHLQSNKAQRAGGLFDVIQTVDSPKLARRLSEAAQRELEVMLEVKLGGEEAKSGARPEDLPALIETLAGCPKLRLTGLMTMPPWSEAAEESRPYFRALRELAVRHGLAGLSMGMSHDLEVAIEEGATHIRVGSAIFGPRRQP
ncbi:MAG: YggS family pyridoxal phosphate-dependent enzyme [Bryobacteraceae bacterium]